LAVKVHGAIKAKLMRSVIRQDHSSAAIKAAPKKSKISPFVKIKPVHKSIIKVMPKRALILGTKPKGMKSASAATGNRMVKTTKPATLRSPIKPRAVAKKKLSIIMPTKKPLGRHSELTSRALRKQMGFMADFGPIFGEFAGASLGISPTTIVSGQEVSTSVPVDKPMDEPEKTVTLLVSGIPEWLDQVKIYYDLLVCLSKHHLTLSDIEFTSHADDGRAAWISVVLNYEAEQLLKAAGYQLKFPVHQVFSIPESIKITPAILDISLVENASGLDIQTETNNSFNINQ